MRHDANVMPSARAPTPATLARAEVMASAFVKDLPFKIVSNNGGRIARSLARNGHGRRPLEGAGRRRATHRAARCA
jgi:hypothetical protein